MRGHALPQIPALIEIAQATWTDRGANMATIESGPLPPPGFRGQIAKITDADRAAIMAQANKVIDFYLNGRGSFTPDGSRKPPVNARI